MCTVRGSPPIPNGTSWATRNGDPWPALGFPVRCESGQVLSPSTTTKWPTPSSSSRRGLTALQKTPNQQCPMAHFAMILALLPHNSQRLFPWARISGGPPLGSVIGSDVANAPTTQTFFCRCCSSTHLQCCLYSNHAEVWWRLSCSFHLQFLRTRHYWHRDGWPHRSNFHHHRSGNTGAAVDDCHNVRPHLCTVWEQMLLCCQLFLKVCGTHAEKISKSHVFG